MNLTALISWPYRLLAMAALAVALIGFGWVKGAGHVQSEWDSATGKQALQVAVVKQRQAEATVQVVTKYIDRIKVVREKGDIIIKEVPTYVTPEADARCVVPRGFVRLHDAAAANQIPGAAGTSDAAASGIALSTAAGTIANNYERCAENSEQLRGLQSWIVEMKKADGEKAP